MRSLAGMEPSTSSNSVEPPNDLSGGTLSKEKGCSGQTIPTEVVHSAEEVGAARVIVESDTGDPGLLHSMALALAGKLVADNAMKENEQMPLVGQQQCEGIVNKLPSEGILTRSKARSMEDLSWDPQ